MLKREPTSDGKRVKVTFIVPDDPQQPRISVVGDFNDWDPAVHKLARRRNNTRSIALVLDSGQQYAFRYYIETGEWFNDDGADGYVENEHGSHNCLIVT